MCVRLVTIFTAVLSDCTHFTAKYTQVTYFALICTIHVRFYGACVVRVAIFSTVVYIMVQTNVARNAFRGYTIIPRYMALFDIICPGPIL